MASPIEKTLDRIGNVVQDIFSGSKSESTSSTADSTKGQTCLEATGMRQRALHLMQNTWRKNDIEYSRPLVLAEYDIQTEFIVSTTDDIVQEQKEKAEAKQAAAIKKAEEKRKKREEKAAKKAAKVAGVNNSQTKTEGSETIVPPEAQMAQAINYYTSPKPVDTYEGFFNAYNNQNGRFAPQQ
jgi:vacuolar-type H+-ATPase subunit H